MTIQFGYKKKEVIQALRYHFLARPEIKILLIVINIFAIASAILFAFHKISGYSFLIFSILWFLLMLIIWRILPASIYKKNATFQDEFMVRFEEQGLELSNRQSARAWSWNQFSNFIESPYFFHLYFDARSFFLVPKDAFSDVETLQAVRALLREKIKS